MSLLPNVPLFRKYNPKPLLKRQEKKGFLDI